MNLRPRFCLSMLCVAVATATAQSSPAEAAEFRAGAAVVDVSPTRFPIAVNGGMTSRDATQIDTPVNARAIVMAQDDVQVAVVVVDSCMLPRDLLDEAKAMASQRTGIAADRITISATHTHTAPAAMSCLGTDADPEYRAYLRIKLTQAIEEAQSHLEPARVGWAAVNAEHYMAIRRWIRRPDRLGEDPFGNPTVRANMHAAQVWDDVTGPSGPEDPDLSLLAIESLEGHKIAVLANLSMHYFSGVPPISADYYGLFSDGLAARLSSDSPAGKHPVVGIMSHGCSGDIWRKDYTQTTPAEFDTITIDAYSQGLIQLAMDAYASIEFKQPETLKMAESRLPLNYRVPNKQLLQWSQQIMDAVGDRLPQTLEEVYAREQIYLHEMQSTEVVVQAIRIGEIAIATTPTETYALTGLKLKLQSPLEQTMVIELANGGDGYIPPPEQHVLGGYNTWPARSAGLEVTAEPKITEAALRLLEQVAEKARRTYRSSEGPAAEKIVAAKPLAYWRLDEMSGPRARDQVSSRDGFYEPGVVFFLEGAESQQFNLEGQVNRAAHFAGGRMRARLGDLPATYSVSLWIWNGMPNDGREVAGWLYSRGNDFGRPDAAEQLGVGGTSAHTGKLILQLGSQPAVGGQTELERWTWNHVLLVRDESAVRVYLNGKAEPEIEVAVDAAAPQWADELFFGGSSAGGFNWEGKLDEIAVFPRAVDPSELAVER